MRAPVAPNRLLAGLISLIALMIAISGAGDGAAGSVLALIVFCIGLWATGAVPEHLTALVFFVLAMAFALAPAEVVFAGFHSGALWLIFGGLVLGVAVHDTGLGARLANRLAALFGASYAGVVFGLLTTGIVFGFLMPSSLGRTVLLLPIALALAERYGFAVGSKGRSGIVLAAAFGCFLTTFAILPANVPNLVLIGIGEELYGLTPTYGKWLLLHFPVLGLLKGLVVGGLILLLLADRPRPRDEAPAPRPMSAEERRLGLILGLALLGWMSDFVHEVPPAWVALGAAVLCMLPRFGVFRPRDFGKIDFAPLFYIAGILGVGTLIAHSGWGARLGELIPHLGALAPGKAPANFLTLAGAGIGVGLGTTLVGIPAVMTPLAADLAEASALSIDTVLMLQVLSFSTPLLPYQAPPLVIAMQLGRIRLAHGTTLLLATGAATLLVLLPLDYLWWRILGMI